MVVNLILQLMSFASGLISTNLGILMSPIRAIFDFVADTITALISLEAFDLAWGWIHWAVPADVWAVVLVVLTLEVAMAGLSFILGVVRFVKVYVPIV